MKTRIFITIALAAMILAPLALAQDGARRGPGPEGPRGEFGPGMGSGPGFGEGGFIQMLMGRMAEELELTGEQKASIKEIMEENKDAAQEGREAVRSAFEKLNEAADEGDEAAVTAAGKAVGDAVTKQAMQRAQVAKKVNAVLTEEQRAKLDEMKAKMKERMQQRMGERRERIEEGGGFGEGPRGPRPEGRPNGERGPRPEGRPERRGPQS